VVARHRPCGAWQPSPDAAPTPPSPRGLLGDRSPRRRPRRAQGARAAGQHWAGSPADPRARAALPAAGGARQRRRVCLTD